MSSAKARSSPLFLTCSNFYEDFNAYSRYMLKSKGKSNDPYWSPVSATTIEMRDVR
jgi:hypothetical protein